MEEGLREIAETGIETEISRLAIQEQEMLVNVRAATTSYTDPEEDVDDRIRETSSENIDDDDEHEDDRNRITVTSPQEDVNGRVQHNGFKGAPWYAKEDVYVMIGGIGGIGSWTTLLLTRAGFKPIVYDDDTLEEGNLGGQLYSKEFVGKPKVEAIEYLTKSLSNDTILINQTRIDSTSPTHMYVIAAFDNMEARSTMFRSWLNMYGHNSDAIFIDGRLEAEWMSINCVRGGRHDDIEAYEKELFTDGEIPEIACTLKQTSHAAAMIAAHITGFFTNHITNVMEKVESRSVPLKWEYFIPMDLLTVQR